MTKPNEGATEYQQLKAKIKELETLIRRSTAVPADDVVRRESEELRAAVFALEQQNNDLERLVGGLRKALSDLRRGQVERLAEMEERVNRAIEVQNEAERERDKAERRLNQVQASFTWKAGRYVKAAIDPLLKVRRAFSRDSSRSGATTAGVETRKTIKLDGEEKGVAADLIVAEDATLKTAYETAVAKRTFSRGDQVRVAMAVTTLDFDDGRGDLFVAVGLGRYLERMGYEIVYLPRDRWYEPPPGTDIYLALLSSVDASRIPKGPMKVAWARNETESWASNPTLNLYHMLLASSVPSLEHLSEVYAGPTRMLPIGVDLELFYPSDNQRKSAVVSTVNQWGRERDVYAALRGQKITFPLAIFGQTRGLSAVLARYSHGPVSFFALPGIYRQAAVVLDDFNHTTIGYGNVNSRLFESIAAGAVPVTNSHLGLADLGLDAVPSYTMTAELHDTVTRLWSDPDARAKLASELAEVVRRDHSFEGRAQQVHHAITEHRSDPPSARTMVAFFPDYRSNNPYQSVLYGSIGPDFIPVPIGDILNLRELELPHATNAVLHIHWTAPILAPAKDSTEAMNRLNDFVAQLERAKAKGVRIVWTIHNVMPHESGFPDLEQVLRQELAEKADVVHVMCDRTLEEVGDYYAIPERKVRLVRHGSYVGVYPDLVDPDLARDRLGYTSEDTVILYLGGIRLYKGVDLLLDAFEKAVIREPSLRLVIAGRPRRSPDVRELERRAAAHPMVASNFNEVADVDLQHFFKASDVVVLPYRSVLNSGSAQLAFSFARPIIAPRLACLPDIEGAGVGLSFNPGDIEGLADCLVNATTLKDRKFQRAARLLADAYTGSDMSRDFAAILKELCGSDSDYQGG